MKKLILLSTLFFIIQMCYSQSPVDDFSVSTRYINCDYIEGTFRIDASQLDYDSLWWHFGDGVRKHNRTSATHLYSHIGSYSVNLEIWKGGIKKVITKDSVITVNTPMDVLFDYFSVDTLLMAPATVFFVNQTVPGNCDSIWFNWEINGKSISDEKDLEYTFYDPGFYSIHLSAYDTIGCEKHFYNGINVKDTAQKGEFPYITSACKYDDISMDDFTKKFDFQNDTLIISGVIGGNCCTEKTATYRIRNDSVFIYTWESGEHCTCSCPFRFEIRIPNITSDTMNIVFDESNYLITKSLSSAEFVNASVFEIYPNPANKYFIIKNSNTSNNLLHYKIFNSQGEKLQEGNTLPNSPVYINRISDSGIIFIKINDGKSETIKKLIIR